MGTFTELTMRDFIVSTVKSIRSFFQFKVVSLVLGIILFFGFSYFSSYLMLGINKNLSAFQLDLHCFL